MTRIISMMIAASILGLGWLVLHTRRLDPSLVFRMVDYEEMDGTRLRYAIYSPPDPRSDEALPLVVFLHGSKEVGVDGKKHLKVGLAPFIYEAAMQRRSPPPFFALFPQAQTLADWSARSIETHRLLDYIDHVCDHYPIDRDRIYLTGHSIGGNGVWSLAARYPDRWAALVPISGWSDPDAAPAIAHLPVWVFQGGRDEAGLVENTRAMIRALRRAGGTPRYTEFPNEGHFIWERVFSRPDLFDWLLQQRKSRQRRK